MHFTIIYILKNKKLEDVSLDSIERDFCDRFCYCNGETRAKYKNYCDWFMIGGRWVDLLKASRGIKGNASWGYTEEELKEIANDKTRFSIVEIKDLIENIGEPYGVATLSKIYDSDSGNEQKKKYVDLINQKKIKGVIALIDCHD